MANRHFGEIGDVWKHLPLAEILAIEKPLRYWESHAGSADYELTPSPARNYGIYHYLANSNREEELAQSRYNYCLASLSSAGDTRRYPGSPFIAMSVLHETGTKFTFCDIDAESLESIERRADIFGFSESDVITRNQDGIKVLIDEIRESDSRAPKTFALLDPYQPLQASRGSLTCVELFRRIATKRFGAILWYGFESPDAHKVCWDGIRRTWLAETEAGISGAIWAIEAVPEVIASGIYDGSGSYIGCGILCCNLSEQSYKVCRDLAMALADVYEEAILPDGRSGALRINVLEKIDGLAEPAPLPDSLRRG